jgi:hypothetical protein
MFKDNRTALYDRDGATDKNCRSRAENDKDQIKSELLFARQPDLVAALTSVPFPPLSPFYGNNEAKFRSLIFFQQTNADCSSTTQSQISADLFAGRAQTHRQRRRTWDQAAPPFKLARRGGLPRSSPKAFGVSSDTRNVKVNR